MSNRFMSDDEWDAFRKAEKRREAFWTVGLAAGIVTLIVYVVCWALDK